MKKLRQIVIFLEEGFSEATTQFALSGSRAVCNHVEQMLARLEHPCSVHRLNIYVRAGSHGPDYRVLPVGFGAITIGIPEFDFNDLSDVDKQEKFILIIESGMSAASDYISIPLDEIDASLNEFREEGYVNRSVHAQKTWKRPGIDAEIYCEFGMDMFSIHQRISVAGEAAGDFLVLKTQSREQLFLPFLGKMKYEKKNDQHIITYHSRNGKVLSTCSITTEGTHHESVKKVDDHLPYLF